MILSPVASIKSEVWSAYGELQRWGEAQHVLKRKRVKNASSFYETGLIFLKYFLFI